MSAIQQLITEHLDIWTAADTGPKSGRGRSAANAAKVYGISKLRELILELAVRGKLVPQDASDEPASELIKHIQSEKLRLISEGKIKKDKPLPAITDEEKPFELPPGWAYSNLGDVVEIIRGITFPGSEKSKTPEKGRIACLRTSNVQDQIEWDDILYVREEFVSREDQILLPRDIVMSMANSRELVGKVALVGEKIHQKTSFGGFLGVLRPFLIEPRFVMALLRTPHTREALIDSASQTTNIANISLAKLRPLFFAIPPLAEQHRIVAKVDELMALCDQLEAEHNNATEAHEKLVNHLLGTLTQSQSAEDFSANWQRIATHFDTLFTTEASIDALKQTLLQLAVMGKLVPQDPNDEPASELLKRIQAEKAKLIAEGKIKKGKPLAAIAEDEKPFEAPMGWEWSFLGQLITKVSDGPHFSPNYVAREDGIPFLSARNIRVDGWELDSVKYVSHSDHKEFTKRTRAEVGDILYTKGGTTGVAKINDLDFDFSVWVHVAVLNIPKKFILNRFLALALNSPHCYAQSQKLTHGISNKDLGLTRMIDITVPLPPLAEQHRIVAKIDELMALCDHIKSRLIDASQLQQKLADVLVGNAVSANVQPMHTGKADAEMDQAAARTLLATEVVHQLNTETRMGRVKLQKVVNLAEYVAGLKEVASEPLRNAAGPHDRHLMDQVLQGMKDRQWYEEQPVDGGNSYRYRPLAKAGQHRADYEALWSPEQRRKISDLIALMRSWKTDQCERVATLYSAWNDLLIEGKEATEANILNEVLNRWNSSKLNYTKAQWQTELAAMKMHALLIPTGFGRRTTGGAQTLLLH